MPTGPSNFRTREDASEDAGVLSAFIEFDTAAGRGVGHLRLKGDPAGDQAWTLLTALQELKGHEERVGLRRPSGDAYSRNFGGLNWLDQREKARAFANRDPTVLVVGGGQNGLAVAACLGQLDIDTLVVDKYPRIPLETAEAGSLVDEGRGWI